MYYPFVGERVWVSGCRDEYIVERADYTASVAAIALVSNSGGVLENMSFRLLFAHFDFEAAQAGVAARPAIWDVLRTSQLCMHQTRVLIRDLRETTRATLTTIRQTRAVILSSDRDIARWKTSGYASEQDKTCDRPE